MKQRYEAVRDSSQSADIAIFGQFPANGGVPRRLANVIKEWVADGFRVEIISYRDGVCFYPDEIEPLVSFVQLGTRSKLTTLLALWRHLRRTRPRVLLSTAHLANLIVSRLSYLPDTGARRFLSIPNTFGEARRRDPARQARKLRQVRGAYERADGVVAISEGVRRDLVETIGIRRVPIHLIWNGSVTAENSRRAREPVAHPWFAVPKTIPVILSVGRLAPQKDQATLIDAVAELRRERECRLVILGEGPLRAELLELARQRGMTEAFDLPGFVDNPYAWMAKADCFVLSSLWEGFPNVLAEALGLGVPVVATDCPSGPADILQKGRFGKLVPMRDVRALAEAIGRTLAGERELFEVSEAVRGFTAEAAARRYIQVFGLAAGGEA